MICEKKCLKYPGNIFGVESDSPTRQGLSLSLNFVLCSRTDHSAQQKWRPVLFAAKTAPIHTFQLLSVLAPGEKGNIVFVEQKFLPCFDGTTALFLQL